jgi:hypothetical protein
LPLQASWPGAKVYISSLKATACDATALELSGGPHLYLACGAYGGEAHQGQYLQGVAIYLASRAGDYAV